MTWMLIVLAAIVGAIIGGAIATNRVRSKWVHRFVQSKFPPVDHYRGAA